ncbi:MAG: hypothetical protein ABII39_05040 [Candidatus Micrarchaeota archaeon]
MKTIRVSTTQEAIRQISPLLAGKVVRITDIYARQNRRIIPPKELWEERVIEPGFKPNCYDCLEETGYKKVPALVPHIKWEDRKELTLSARLEACKKEMAGKDSIIELAADGIKVSIAILEGCCGGFGTIDTDTREIIPTDTENERARQFIFRNPEIVLVTGWCQSDSDGFCKTGIWGIESTTRFWEQIQEDEKPLVSISMSVLDRLVYDGAPPIDRRVLKLEFDIPGLGRYEQWKRVLNLELGDVTPNIEPFRWIKVEMDGAETIEYRIETKFKPLLFD